MNGTNCHQQTFRSTSLFAISSLIYTIFFFFVILHPLKVTIDYSLPLSSQEIMYICKIFLQHKALKLKAKNSKKGSFETPQNVTVNHKIKILFPHT